MLLPLLASLEIGRYGDKLHQRFNPLGNKIGGIRLAIHGFGWLVWVAGLGNLEKLSPVVRALGARHADYGVQPRHYMVVGAALLWTLEQGLGNDFTPEVREAWAGAYDLLSQVMQLGAMEPATA